MIWEQLADGRRWALATVVRQLHSAPREAGTMMAVSADGDVVGNVTAGCVDGAVYEVAQRVLATGEAELTKFAVSDDTALGVGLSCGGTIEIIVTVAPPPEILATLIAAINNEEPITLVTDLATGQHTLTRPQDRTPSEMPELARHDRQTLPPTPSSTPPTPSSTPPTPSSTPPT
ncbi:MAG: XdhC family protein, partial [Propionibacteriaceae bacterium]|nr:XdhC family protein [Propionibacteriaceae bacterium]